MTKEEPIQGLRKTQVRVTHERFSQWRRFRKKAAERKLEGIRNRATRDQGDETEANI